MRILHNNMDEILVKGKDGKWYILREDGLVLYEEGQAVSSRFHDQPKGVSREEHARFEGKDQRAKIKEQVAAPVSASPKPLALRPTPPSHEEHPLKVELEEIVEEVIKNVKLKMQNVGWLDDQVLSKRFRTIVSSRLRDVRDRSETVEILKRSKRIGGLEISELDTNLVMEIIEKAFAEFQTKWRVVENKKMEEWKKKQTEKWASGEDKEKEKQELEERYRKLVGERGGSAGVAEDTAPAPLGARSGDRGATAKTLPTPRSSSAGTTPMLSESQLSRPAGLLGKQAAASSFQGTTPLSGVEKKGEKKEVGGGEKKMLMPPPPMVVKSVPKVAVASKPSLNLAPPPTPALSRGERGIGKSKPYTLTPKPPQKLTDVRKAPQLLGPFEELSTLTISDFRRLAQDPRERTTRILGKIEFIGKESLSRKLQAKEAWLKSPLYQEYFRIMRKAFLERTTPLKILESAGQATLTKDEWYAIMEMNQKLRF